MFEEKARSLEPTAPGSPSRLLRRARVRRARVLGALAAVSVALGVATALVTRVSPTPPAYAKFTLVDAATGSGVSQHPGDHSVPAHHYPTSGDPMSAARLQDHARCMRTHGVDVPDPVETAQGWMIPVNDSVIRSDVKAWREAFFVDCRLEDVNQNLVLGGRTREQIDDLIACARTKGYELPAPTVDAQGQYTFDLEMASPPWGSDHWYRTLFVGCAGSLPAP
jgi:hypothetical protein